MGVLEHHQHGAIARLGLEQAQYHAEQLLPFPLWAEIEIGCGIWQR
jgi:predicted ATPase